MTRSRSGFSMLQLLMYLAVAGLLAVSVIGGYDRFVRNAKAVRQAEAADLLNRASESFLTEARGTFKPDSSAADYLEVLQTPVDETSQRAGFGAFALIDPKWILANVQDEGAPRLVVEYSAAKRRPVWSVTNSGPGYVVEIDRDRQTPAAADWSAYVNEKAKIGMVGDHKREWLWASAADGAPSEGDLNKPGPDQSNYETGTTNTLRIFGPDTITAPGTGFFWTGISSQPGTLSISFDGYSTTQADAGTVESVKRNFGPGASGNYLVSFVRAEGGNASKHVHVSVPDVPVLEITGPEKITKPEPQTWTASVTNGVTPAHLSLFVDDIHDSKDEVSSLSITHEAWLEGTKKTITVVASASNVSGFARATKTTVVDIPVPPPPPGEDDDPEVDDTTVAGAWTVSVSGDGNVASITLSGIGGTMTVTDGARAHTFKKALSAGEYTITGSAVVDGQTIPAKVNGAEGSLSLIVDP